MSEKIRQGEKGEKGHTRLGKAFPSPLFPVHESHHLENVIPALPADIHRPHSGGPGGHHILDTLRAGGREATSDLAVTLSAGLTSWDGAEAANSLIERAEQALTRAKDSGRNRVVSIQAFTEF